MKNLSLYISMLLMLTCAKEDSQINVSGELNQVKKYNINVTANSGGEVNTNGGNFSQGIELILIATPKTGYNFTGWSNGSLENPLNLIVTSDTNISANFELVAQFIPKSPSYSNINQTTSEFYSQYYFQKYMTRDVHESIFWDEENIRYMIQENDAVYYDFDSNGTLDFFGFAYWSNLANDGEWGTNPGKYVLINDFFLGNREKLTFDTQLSFGGKMDLSDLNNDGVLDVLMYSNNIHQNSSSAYNSTLNELPVEYVRVNNNVFTSSFIGPPISSHDGSSGDIDNDGDIDVLLISLNDSNTNRDNIYPIVLINNGSGDFVEEFAFTDNENFISLNYVYMSEFNDYESLHYELFDLNNDGNLDIISGFNIESNDQYVNREREGIDIFWGDGTGKFTTSNSSKVYANDLEGYQYSLLGSSYLDFDNDGDLDIFSVSTRAESGNFVSDGGVIDNGANFYQNYAIHLFENNNGEFEDVTHIYIDKNKDLSKTRFSHFYDLNFRDIDNDGDYDLIPSRTSGWFTFPQLNNLYWENNAGYFEIREVGGLNYSQ